MSCAVVPVIETLEGRRLLAGDASVVQSLPFSLDFNSAVPSVITDKAGQGTGFTWVQPNKNGNEYQPALLDLQPANGVLNITTTGTATAGGSWESDNTLVDAVETQFNAASGAFTITTRLKGPLGFLSNPSDQGGINFGPDQDNYIKFVAASQSQGQFLQFADEQLPAGATSFTHSIATANSYTSIGAFANVNTLDLQISADPSSGIVTGSYAVNGGAFTAVSQSVTLTGSEKSAFFSGTARAGLIAMAKNNLPPVTVSFDNFSIAAAPVSNPPPAGPKLTGTVIGTAGSFQNNGNTGAKAFDGSLNTYFDGPTTSGDWVGLDLGSPSVIAQIKYAPRGGFTSRMVGGIFQGSNVADFSSGVVNLFTVSSSPAAGAFTTQITNNSSTFRFVRYLAPANSYGNVAEIEFDNAVTAPAPQPSIASTTPASGASGVLRTAFVSCDLNLPNVGAGIDANTLTRSTVFLYRTFDHKSITAELNTDGAGSVIILQPDTPLDASTGYTFVVTSGVKDVSGAAFQPFQMSFTTGSDSITTDPNIAFEKVSLPTAVNQPFTGLTVGPDGKMYATTASGDIFQYTINPDGTLGNPFDIKTMLVNNGNSRLITGITFDAAGNMWVSSGAGTTTNAPDWTGKITRLSGANYSVYQDYVVGLPRSIRDHLNNQPSFGPDGALYWPQGAMSAMGAPDSVWGFRNEHLLSAAILRLDVNAAVSWPINVQTESLPQGQAAYNPFATGAPVTIYASGVRNAYDLIWDSNGHLYAPTNGSAGGGNTPASPPAPFTATNRIDSSTRTYTGPAVPALNNLGQAEDDWLFDIIQGGYYGHPDPARSEYVMNGGNPQTSLGANFPIQGAYPAGTNPDPNYRGIAFDFGVHYSPDGAIEYHGSAFNGALDHALLITRYSGGKDILLLRVGANGQITQSETGIAGFTQFTDPIDITEDPHTGYLYVAELGGLKITLLRPLNVGGNVTVSAPTLYFNDPTGGGASPTQTLTISNTGNQPLALPSDGLSVLGSDGALFPIVSKPSLPLSIQVGGSISITIAFNAGTSALGLHTAELQIKSNDPNQPLFNVNLRALTTAGTGGNNEPSLQRILDLFQIQDNVGSANPNVTAFTTPPQTPNDEVTMPRLVKAGPGPVTITPLAAFSASITPSAGIGFYSPGTYDSLSPLFTINAADAQSVDPTAIGKTSFDPGSAIFGLFASFDAFPDSTGKARIAYSEDALNTWDTTNHRKVRFYPMKNPDGSVVPNSFVFATEDYGVAPSYDSNDVVGVISNVKAAPSGADLGTQNLDAQPFADRLVFNNIQNLNTQFPNVVHKSDTLRLWNTGDQALNISSISSSNAFFTVGGSLTFPLTIAAGAFQDIVINYVPTHNSGVSAVDIGTLTINSSAINAPTKTIDLRGFWQQYSNATPGGTITEPTVAQIVNTEFGYGTNIINAGQSMNQGARSRPSAKKSFLVIGCGPIRIFLSPLARLTPFTQKGIPPRCIGSTRAVPLRTTRFSAMPAMTLNRSCRCRMTAPRQSPLARLSRAVCLDSMSISRNHLTTLSTKRPPDRQQTRAITSVSGRRAIGLASLFLTSG